MPSPYSCVLTVTGPARAGKDTLIRGLFDGVPGVFLFSVSEYIRGYAVDHGIQPDSRIAYSAAHDVLQAKIPHAITDQILRLAETDVSLVVVNGLRVYQDAQRLQEVIGDSYNTIALVCDGQERYRRELHSPKHSGQSLGKQPTPDEFFKDEEIDYNPRWGFSEVIAMHNVSDSPLDTTHLSPIQTIEAGRLILRSYVPMISHDEKMTCY